MEGVGYADDCCILMGGTNQSHMISRVQRAVNKLILWGSTCGLRFNHSKTVIILFAKNNKTFRRHIKIDGNDIPYSQQVKYLGLTLDSKLSWLPHIKGKARSCKRFLFMVAQIAKDAYGPSPKIMRWTFHCVVCPMLTYGALCWAHMVFTGDLDDILRNLNRAGMNTYSNFPRSTPTRTVEIITDTLPLSLQAQKVGLSSCIRLKEVVNQDWLSPESNSRSPNNHIGFWDNLIFENNLEEFLGPDDSISLRMPFKNFTVVTDSFSGHDKFLSSSQYNVYTDGSKLNNKVGSGVFIETNNSSCELSFRLPDESSVFQAEIFAINQAAIALRNYDTKYTKFFVDSQAAPLALNRSTITLRLVGDTVHNLNLLSESIRLVWIKAHAGHAGNEKADDLAKAGTSLTYINPIA